MAFSRQEYRSGFPLPSPESLKRIHKITAQFVESFTQLSSLLRNLYAGQEATVRTGHEKMGWFKIGKEYIKAVHCHSAYLTYMQSTS